MFDMRWMVITIFNLKRWHTLEHNPDQMKLFENIDFKPIRGHSELYVADVSREEIIMLILMGLDVDQTIASDLPGLVNRTRMLYKSKDEYVIIEIHHANVPFDK